MKSKDLTIRQFSALNELRALHWHSEGGLDSWSPAEWGNALAGEVGELCNVLKKLLRHDMGIQQLAVENREPTKQSGTRAKLLVDAAKEIADSYTYLDLVAARLGLDVQQCVVSKFNEISEREGLPMRFESRYELPKNHGQEDST